MAKKELFNDDELKALINLVGVFDRADPDGIIYNMPVSTSDTLLELIDSNKNLLDEEKARERERKEADKGWRMIDAFAFLLGSKLSEWTRKRKSIFDLGRILTGHRTAADVSDAAVGIAGELAPGHTTVSKGTAKNESAGRIHELCEVGVQPVLCRRSHHQFFNDRSEVLDLNITDMLYRAAEGRDSAGIIIEADLRLGIGFQHTAGVRFQKFQKSGCDHIRDREQFRRFVGRIAIHHTLISGATNIHTEGNVTALMIDQNRNIQIISSEVQLVVKSRIAVLSASVVDVVEYLLHQSLVVRLMGTGQLTGDHKAAVLEKTFYRNTTAAVMLKAVGHDCICDLVTDLVGMSCGNLF